MNDIQALNIFNSAYNKMIEDSSLKRIREYIKFKDFYDNDYDEIVNHVRYYFTVERPLLKQATFNKLPFRHVSYIPKILTRKTAGIFDNLPTITLENATKQQADLLNEILTKSKFYQFIRDSFRKSLYYGLTENYVKWNGSDNIIDLEILTPDMFQIVQKEDDYTQKSKIIIQKSRTVLDGNVPRFEIYYAVWTESEHYYLFADGRESAVKDGENMINPYGIIPVTKLQFEKTNDYYGNPNYDLLNTQIWLDFARSWKAYQYVFSTSGIWLSTNTSLSKDSSLSPGEIVDIKDVRTEMIPPSLEFIAPNIDWRSLEGNIEYEIKDIARSQGLSAASADIDPVKQSGISKIIDESELEEIRNSYKEVLYDWMQDTLNTMRIVWNNFSMNKLPEKNDFIIQFSEEKAIETITDKLVRREMEKKFFIKSEVDFIMEDLEVDETKALEILNKNRNLAQTPTFNVDDLLTDETDETDITEL